VAGRGGKKFLPPKYLSCVRFSKGLGGIFVLLFRIEDKLSETTDDSIQGWRNLKPRDKPVQS
jgi:hypothetical protein